MRTSDDQRLILLVHTDEASAHELSHTLRHLGHKVVGPFMDPEHPRGWLDGMRPDVAIIDASVDRLAPLANVLRDRGVPLVYIGSDDPVPSGLPDGVWVPNGDFALDDWRTMILLLERDRAG